MAKKTYLLTIEYDSDTDTIEYLQEEVIDNDNNEIKSLGDFDLETRFDKEILDLIREHYIVGES